MDDSDVVVTTVDDALIRGGNVLVLVGSEVMLLGEVSSEIVRVCAAGATVADLGEHLFSVFGPPPKNATVPEQTRHILAQLREVGVVAVTSSVGYVGAPEGG